MFQLKTLGVYAGLIVMLLSIILPVQAGAQSFTRPPLSLVTSPLPLNIVAKPGETVTADIRVKNNGTRSENIKVELLKFGAGGETGSPQLLDRGERDDYFDWVSFSERNFKAEPNVWKTIKMTVKAPPSAAFGYYMAVVFTRADPDKPTGGASGVEGGVASLVLLNVDAPGAKREAKVLEFSASQKVYEFLPADFKVKVRNSGNVHVSPAGSIFIKQGDKQIEVMEFNTQQGNILPGTNRVFENTWDKGFPRFETVGEGNDKKKKLVWNFQDLQDVRIGKFTATLVAVYDDGQRDVPIEAVVSFWVIPWRIIGGILLVLLVISIGVWAILRLIWKNIRRNPPAAPQAPTDPPAAPPADPPATQAPAEEQPAPSEPQPAAPASANNLPTAPEVRRD